MATQVPSRLNLQERKSKNDPVFSKFKQEIIFIGNFQSKITQLF